MAKGKGRKHNKSGRSEIGSRHVRLEYWLLEHPAFLALSSDAKVVLVYLAKRFDGFNNGRIGFGVRSGCHVRINGLDSVKKSIGLSKGRTQRALDLLEAAGFIVCTQDARFDQKRLVREWRLTWLSNPGERATKEFASVTQGENSEASTTTGAKPVLQPRERAYGKQTAGENWQGSPICGAIAQLDSPTCETHLVTIGDGCKRGSSGIHSERENSQN